MIGQAIVRTRQACKDVLAQRSPPATLAELMRGLGRELDMLEGYIDDLRYIGAVWAGFAENVDAFGQGHLPALVNQTRHIEHHLQRLQARHASLVPWRVALNRWLATTASDQRTHDCERLLQHLIRLIATVQALLNSLGNLHAELTSLHRLGQATIATPLGLLAQLLKQQIEGFRQQLR